jgi:hypothetical protein
MMREDGGNLGERGGNITLTNVSYVTLETCFGLDRRRELFRPFQIMARDRTRFAFDSFLDYLEKSVRGHNLIGWIFAILPVSKQSLDRYVKVCYYGQP